MNIEIDDFQRVMSREYWITSNGDIAYVHELNNEQLVDTIKLIHRKAKKHRIEKALILCNMTDKIGYDGRDTDDYYRCFKKQVDAFLDTDISDEKWLKQNSKIYALLTEEAKFRGIEVKIESEQIFKKKIMPVFKKSKISFSF